MKKLSKRFPFLSACVGNVLMLGVAYLYIKHIDWVAPVTIGLGIAICIALLVLLIIKRSRR